MAPTRPIGWRRWRTSALVVAAVSVSALLAPGGAGGAGAELGGEGPYIRLFTQAGVGSQQANTAAGIEELAGWYRHVHAETANSFPLGEPSKTSAADTTLAEKLTAAGVWVEIDLPLSTVTGPGTYAFAVRTTSSSLISFSSRETTSRPQLIVETGS